jgi:aspartate aminotransferase
VAERRRIYEARRDLVVRELTGACGLPTVTPGGAFYAMPRIAGYLGRTHPRCGRIADDVAFCKALLDIAQVATVPGSAFGAPGYVRLSFATSETVLREGISRLAEFLSDCR